MNFTMKSVKCSIMQWDTMDSHIAIEIGTIYISFAPDKNKPQERVYDQNGNPVSRNNVPGLSTQLRSPLYRYHGIFKTFKEDLDLYTDAYRSVTFNLPAGALSKLPTERIPGNYQLFDAVQGDNSHNNCVDYVRSEIFALLGDGYMDLKDTLEKIHTPLEFFNALKTHRVLQQCGAWNVIFYKKFGNRTHKSTNLG